MPHVCKCSKLGGTVFVSSAAVVSVLPGARHTGNSPFASRFSRRSRARRRFPRVPPPPGGAARAAEGAAPAVMRPCRQPATAAAAPLRPEGQRPLLPPGVG